MSVVIHIFQEITSQLRLSSLTENISIFIFFTLSVIIFSNSFEFKIFNLIKGFEYIIKATFAEETIYKNSIDLIMTLKD